jgi:hypothetical protein
MTEQDHVCGPDCQCGCEAGLTIPVPRPSSAAQDQEPIPVKYDEAHGWNPGPKGVVDERAARSTSLPRCAVCGLLIEAEAEPIGGVYGRGFRHANYAICAEQLSGADPYGD